MKSSLSIFTTSPRHFMIGLGFTAAVVMPSRFAHAAGAAVAIMSAAQKAAVSYKCAVISYFANGKTAVQNVYPHCFAMENRSAAKEYRWKVKSASDHLERTFVLLPSGSKCTNWIAPDNSHIYVCMDGIVDTAAANGFPYHFIPHVWCRDPNPPINLETSAPFPTCRPFAFTFCTDPNGNTKKGKELADMAAQLCPSAQYEARWYSKHNIDDPPP